MRTSRLSSLTARILQTAPAMFGQKNYLDIEQDPQMSPLGIVETDKSDIELNHLELLDRIIPKRYANLPHHASKNIEYRVYPTPQSGGSRRLPLGLASVTKHT